MIKRFRGKALICIGLVCILAALGRMVWQGWEAGLAEDRARALMAGLEQQRIVEQANANLREQAPSGQSAVTQLADYTLVGSVCFPTLGLELPVQDSWSYQLLKSSPCRYSGSVAGNDLILMAHNYQKHFGRIGTLQTGDRVEVRGVDGAVTAYTVLGREILEKDQLDELTGGEGDLTLFTCTRGGERRVVVRCERSMTDE